MTGPLAGYRVIDLTVTVLGPLASQLLGDAGAEVLKIEPPEGDPMRHVGPSRNPGMGALFANLNRNKQSKVLDLKTSAGHAALLELVRTADVFMHSMRPGAAKRLRLGYEDLVAINPKLVYASASGFRQGSSLAEKPAYDDIIQGMSGLAWLNRDASGAPRFLPTIIADKVSGHLLAHAITLALLHRERKGEGQEVHVPMMDSMAAFNLIEHLWGATIGEPGQGLGYTRLMSPYRRPYATRDGFVCVMAVTDEQWQRLFAAIGRDDLIGHPDYATLAERARNINAVLEILATALLARTSLEWRDILDKADIPAAVANSLEDLLHDPYLTEVGFFQSVQHPSEGAMTVLAPPVAFSRSPLSIRRLPPRLGEHDAD